MSRVYDILKMDLTPELASWFRSTAKTLGLSHPEFLQKLRELWEKSQGEKGEEK